MNEADYQLGIFAASQGSALKAPRLDPWTQDPVNQPAAGRELQFSRKILVVIAWVLALSLPPWLALPDALRSFGLRLQPSSRVLDFHDSSADQFFERPEWLDFLPASHSPEPHKACISELERRIERGSHEDQLLLSAAIQRGRFAGDHRRRLVEALVLRRSQGWEACRRHSSCSLTPILEQLMRSMRSEDRETAIWAVGVLKDARLADRLFEEFDRPDRPSEWEQQHLLDVLVTIAPEELRRRLPRLLLDASQRDHANKRFALNDPSGSLIPARPWLRRR